jgi:hypothetical protein
VFDQYNIWRTVKNGDTLQKDIIMLQNKNISMTNEIVTLQNEVNILKNSFISLQQENKKLWEDNIAQKKQFNENKEKIINVFRKCYKNFA